MSTARRLMAPAVLAAALFVGAGAFAQDSAPNTPSQSDTASGSRYGRPGGYGMMAPGYGDRGYGMMAPGYGRSDDRRDRDFADRGRRSGPGGFGMPMMWQGDSSAYLEGRIAFVGAELQLSDAQKPAWDKFAEALRANGKRQDALRGAMRDFMFGDRQADLAGHLDQEEQFLATHLDSVRALKAALAPLVAALDENQRRVLNDLARFGMVGMMGPGARAGRFGG